MFLLTLEEIFALDDALPAMPPKDAICHNGIVPQSKCKNCQRLKKAHAIIKSARSVVKEQRRKKSSDVTAKGDENA